MLNRKDINTYGPPGFNLGQKEKDYLQHWILYYLSQSGFRGVFKGGTALQKAFSLPRYSEDLDFTQNDAEELNFESMKAFLESAGFSGISRKQENSEGSDRLRLRFHGPLYDGSAASEATVILDFSKRERTCMKGIPTFITSPYPDIMGGYSVIMMDKSEIAAEKVRAIFSRTSARDLFDLYFLMNQKVIIDKKILDKKLEYYKLKFDHKSFEERLRKLRPIWKTEIGAFTSNVLEFKKAEGLVNSQMRKMVHDRHKRGHIETKIMLW